MPSAADPVEAAARGNGSATPGDASPPPGNGSAAPGTGSAAPGSGSAAPGNGSAAPGDGCERALRELAPAELAAWRGMLRVHAALVKALDAELLHAHDLPLISYEVLITLDAAPGRRRRMADVADSVLLSRSGTTRLVDRLVGKGLIAREECADDGRGSFAVLTDDGAELLEQARTTHLEGVRERFLRHFDEDELRVLAAAWERVLPGSAPLEDLSPRD